LVGLSFAKALAYELEIPFIGVNHLEGHLAANFIGKPMPSYPYVGLLVSGGHTELTHHRKGSIEILGSTVDDAVGEAYDKTAKILGLGYPGGPIIDRLAQKGNPEAVRFTQPKQKGRFDFSFSGIKTAVMYLAGNAGARFPRPKRYEGRGDPAPTSGPNFLTDLCASFQKTVVDWLVEKSIDACRAKKAKEIVVGGGVSANSRLRSLLVEEAELYRIGVWFPPLSLTVDNGAMIARRGWELYRAGKHSDWKCSARPDLRIGES
jgi:N6-L-threonylcarbamoyladenine synthase